MLKLNSMTQTDFEIFMQTSKKNYIADKMKANGLTLDEATRIANEDFARYLSDGFKSKNNFLFMINNGDENIGHLWYVVRGNTDNKKAFIADILLYEKFRGQGYGRKAMLLLEDHVKSQNLSTIGLHVFGFNENAIALYKSLGYLATDISMEKSLK